MLLNAPQAAVAYRTARERGFAILAVNADSPAAIIDALEAARSVDAPVIVETSLWQLKGRSFGNGDAALGMARYLADCALLAEDARYADVPLIFHTDHIKGAVTLPLLKQAVAGFPLHEARLRPSSISLDSSEMTEAENIAAIGAIAAEAARLDLPVTLEMEAGIDDGITPLEVTERLIGGVEGPHPGRLALYAPGAGTRHGYSAEGFPGFDPTSIRAHADCAAAICGRPIGIALHGSSGLSDDQLRAAVAAGVAKVNWSSDSLNLRAQAARRYWIEAESRLARDHRDFKATAMDTAVQDAVATTYVPAIAERMRVLGSAGMGAVLRQAIGSARSLGAQA